MVAPAGSEGEARTRAAAIDTVAGGHATPWQRQPRWIMFRSLAVPGWGQWANGKHLKAVVVAAGEGYLVWRAIDYGRQEGDKADEARLASEDPVRQAELLERKRYYGSRRRDFTWWSVFAVVLSMGDAYVDAQLGPFDPEFLPQDGTGGAGLDRSGGVRLGLRVVLP
jgi:hypothetical protein